MKKRRAALPKDVCVICMKRKVRVYKGKAYSACLPCIKRSREASLKNYYANKALIASLIARIGALEAPGRTEGPLGD